MLAKASSSALADAGRFFQPSALCSVIRALASIKGMSRACASRIRFGHSSLSTNRPSDGRQWSRNPPTAPGVSTGAYWWMTPSGRRWAIIPAEVRVPVVTSTDSSGRRSASRAMTGSSDRLSPTLIACIQTSAPLGRPTPA